MSYCELFDTPWKARSLTSQTRSSLEAASIGRKQARCSKQIPWNPCSCSPSAARSMVLQELCLMALQETFLGNELYRSVWGLGKQSILTRVSGKFALSTFYTAARDSFCQGSDPVRTSKRQVFCSTITSVRNFLRTSVCVCRGVYAYTHTLQYIYLYRERDTYIGTLSAV